MMLPLTDPPHDKLVIGMVHLLPLAGAPRFAGSFPAVREAALRDARALADGGIHAIMIENFGDVPFSPGRAAPAVIAQLTAIALDVGRAVNLPLGINVLRNDGQGALAIALAAGAQFVRVNILCGARVTDQGIIQGMAHDLLRDRAALGAGSVRILADIDVKHSAALAPRPLADDVADTIHRGLADAVIVSGGGTGQAADLDKVKRVRIAAAGQVPVLVGSGITARTIDQYLPHADGFIVGTSLKRDGRVENPVEPGRVRELMARVR